MVVLCQGLSRYSNPRIVNQLVGIISLNMSDQALPKPTAASAPAAAQPVAGLPPVKPAAPPAGPGTPPVASGPKGTDSTSPALPEIEDVGPAAKTVAPAIPAAKPSQPSVPPQPAKASQPSAPPKMPSGPIAKPAGALPTPVPPKEIAAGVKPGIEPKPGMPMPPVQPAMPVPPQPAKAPQPSVPPKMPSGPPTPPGVNNPGTAPAGTPATKPPMPPVQPVMPTPVPMGQSVTVTPPSGGVAAKPLAPITASGSPVSGAAAMPPQQPPAPRPAISAVPPMPKPGSAPAAGPVGMSPQQPPRQGGVAMATTPAGTPAAGMPVSFAGAASPAPSPAGLPPMPAAAVASGSPLPPAASKPGTPPAPVTAATTPGTLTPTPAGGATPKSAAPKKSILRFLPFVVGGLVLIGVIAFLLMRVFGGPADFSNDTNDTTGGSNQPNNQAATSGKQVDLTYWGLWEPEEVMETILADYMEANPNVDITYVKQSPKDYRERLQTAVASGNGPDLFRFHASWVPMLKGELSSMPNSVMSTSEYQRTFYPVAAQQLTNNGQIVGMPLMYDGLVLYYNKDMLQAAGAEVPTTWSALRTLAIQLTVRSAAGLERGGLAIGNASNVEHYGDILGLLVLQNGGDLSNPTSNEARDALTFYTNFIKTDKVWDDTLPSSTVAFARGEAAMMIAPSWRALEIQAANPNLNFGVASVPKLAENKISWGTYWAEGVSAQSKNKEEAWKLLKFMTTAENMKKLYAAQAQVRKFGEPYSRVDLATELAADPYLGAVVADAPSAKAGYLNTFTFDNGLNDQLLKYYADAINAVLEGKQPAEALVTVDQGTKQVFRQYGVTATAPSGS